MCTGLHDTVVVWARSDYMREGRLLVQRLCSLRPRLLRQPVQGVQHVRYHLRLLCDYQRALRQYDISGKELRLRDMFQVGLVFEALSRVVDLVVRLRTCQCRVGVNRETITGGPSLSFVGARAISVSIRETVVDAA